MLYLVACILGIGAGIAAKGDILNIANFKLEKVYLVILAFILQTMAQILSVRGITFLIDHSLVVYGVVFLLVVVAFWYNRHYLGVLIMGAGLLMNVAVMGLNNGKMPVALEAAKRAGLGDIAEALKSGSNGKHILLTESTRLPWLADIIAPPSVLGVLMRIVSIGDLIIVVGLAVLVFEMVSHGEKKLPL